jgi:antirestriction protein ArdC
MSLKKCSALCRCRHKTLWTAHESRLARDFGTKGFGSEGYAIEELVAELGAVFSVPIWI